MNLLSGAEIQCPLGCPYQIEDFFFLFFFKKIYENFVGTLETVRNREESFNIREVSIFSRDSTVIKTPPS